MVRFRMGIAVGLLIQYLEHLRETVPLLAWSGLHDPGWQGAAPSLLGSGLSPGALQGVFGLGIVASVALLFGRLARPAAVVLYALSVATYHAVGPLATLGDYLANVSTLVLALTPAGGTASLGGRPAVAHADAKRATPGGAAVAYLALVAVVYLTAGLGELRGGPRDHFVEWSERLLPVVFVVPSRVIRRVGIVAQLAIHAYWIARGSPVSDNVLLASSGLLLGDEGARSSSQPSLPRAVFDGGAVCALAAMIVLIGAQCAVALGARHAAAPALRFLWDTGLLPASARAVRDGLGVLRVVAEGTGASEAPVADGTARAGALIAALTEGDAQQRLGLLAGVARRHCARAGYWGWEGAVVLRGDKGDRRLLEFECGLGGTLGQVR